MGPVSDRFARGLVRVAAGAFALVPFFLSVHTLTLPAIPVVGAIGVILAGAGIVMLWRWAVTAAACVFLVDYTAALWIAAAPASVVKAAAFGSSLLLLFQGVEIARWLREAEVGARVFRAWLATWATWCAGALAATMLVVGLGSAGAAVVPFAVAPLVAALAAVGVVLALVAAMK